MATRGGYRPGAGRKSKAEEVALLDKLKPMEPDFLRALDKLIKEGNPAGLKMFADYYYGKPVERFEHSGVDGEAIQTEGKHIVEFRDYGDKATVQHAIQASIRN